VDKFGGTSSGCGVRLPVSKLSPDLANHQFRMLTPPQELGQQIELVIVSKDIGALQAMVER
jgi:hypothetical protein